MRKLNILFEVQIKQ